MTESPGKVFERLFQYDSVAQVFEENISERPSRGVDRIGVRRFEAMKKEQFGVISRKCLDGTYKFAPYLERLQLRSRDRRPRALSVATVRDRVVLFLLKELLHQVFPECVGRRVPNAYVRSIKGVLTDSPAGLAFIKADIRSFYDTIDQDYMFRALKKRIDSPRIIQVLWRAIRSPTVPRNHKRSDRRRNVNRRGVPQGLAISSVLANVSLLEFDEKVKAGATAYFRYVDDMLLLVPEADVDAHRQVLNESVHDLKLELSDHKTTWGTIPQPFEYLGYSFRWPEITVRESTVERYLHPIARQFSAFKYGSDVRARDNKWLNREMLAKIFVDEVNERITGAVSGNRRYGWLFYFLELTDLSLLHTVDAVIARFFERLPEFNRRPPTDLKRIARA